MAVIAGVVLTQYDSASHDQILGTAQVIAADISQARNLAVTNNSSYRISFDSSSNCYTLVHSGANSALDVLPDSAFHSVGASCTQYTTNLSLLPCGSGDIAIAVVEAGGSMMASAPEQVFDIEFGPLGETTRSLRTTVWLSAGPRRGRKFVGIEIDPITGFTSIGTVTTSVPYSLGEQYMNEEMEAAYADLAETYDAASTEMDYVDATSNADPTYSEADYLDYADPAYTDYSDTTMSEPDAATTY